MNEQIKQILLQRAESLTKETIECLFEIIEIIVDDSDSKTHDIVLKPMLPMLKQLVLTYVDQIVE